MENLNQYKQLFVEIIMTNGLKLLLAILTLVVGFWIVKVITKSINKLADKKNMDASLKPFLVGLLSFTLKALVIISVLSMVGIQMTSFIALLGAIGLAIGMSLSGTLQNFAGGTVILILRPFKVGDFIEAQGYLGAVKEILIFNTILTTPDNKTVILPNGPLSSGSIVNFSTQPNRRVDLTFGISYSDDIDKAKAVLSNIISSDERVLKDPEPTIAVSQLGDSSVNFVVRPWVDSSNYWSVYFDVTEKVKKEFDKNAISIPFPQTDVHIYNK